MVVHWGRSRRKVRWRTRGVRLSVFAVGLAAILSLCLLGASVLSERQITTDSNTLRLWTGTYDASYGESVFSSIVVYGEDNKAFKAALTDIFPYYCCETAVNPEDPQDAP